MSMTHDDKLAPPVSLAPDLDAALDAEPELDDDAAPIHDPERREPEADVAADACRHLTTKMLYVKGRDGCDLTQTSTTAQYICLRSHQVVGPDDAPVCPGDCVRARGCFEEI